MGQASECKLYWFEVSKMWLRRHGLGWNVVWKASPFFTILGIIGIFALEENWQLAAIAVLSLFGGILIVSLMVVTPFRKWQIDTIELAPYRKIKEEQLGKEGNWLHLVVERVDISTDFGQRSIRVQFQIDSGLVYDWQPERLWLTPIIGGYEPQQPQREIQRVSNFLHGQRSSLPTWDITVTDDALWKRIEEVRRGADMPKGLKVEMKPASSSDLIVLRSQTA